MNIFYGRCSTLKQKNSIDTQMDLVSNYCSINDITLDKIIIDDGVSGKTQNREGLIELMELVKDNKVDNLIVLSLREESAIFSHSSILIDGAFKYSSIFLLIKIPIRYFSII